MKVIATLAAAVLVFGVTAAAAQAPSSGASKPGATTNTDPEVPAIGVKGNDAKSTGQATPKTMPSTTGSGRASSATGGSNPNPSSDKNPDSEVPGHKQN